MNEWGFTNDRREYEQVVLWRTAAIQDHWIITPTYQQEIWQRACSLEREGYKAMILTRDDSPKSKFPRPPEHFISPGKWLYEAQINIWGPDGLHIPAPDPYDWQTIKEGVCLCTNPACLKRVDQTYRVGFAGRYCLECIPAMKKIYEKPGWYD